MMIFKFSVVGAKYFFWSNLVKKNQKWSVQAKFDYLQSFQNPLRTFNALPNFPFTTNEAIRDYYL